MEEKILARFDQMEEKLDKMEGRFYGIEEMIIKENAKLKDEIKKELREEFKQENTKLKEELGKELGKELKEELRKKLREDMKKEILDHMFVFEEEYGRKLTIAVEMLTSENNKEKMQNESIANLERITQMNTAYVYNHEERIDKLEKVQ